MIRPSKYRAQKTEVDGITFDSKAEARRYADLKMLERSDLIRNLELQPKFTITINGVVVCKYIADFRYVDPKKIGPNGEVGCVVIEDTKGFRTPVYRLKKKLVEAYFPGVVILETGEAA